MSDPNLAVLVKAIAHNRAITFVGSGIAASCEVPLWKNLLADCVDRARRSEANPSNLDIVRSALDRSDYPLAADLLEQRITHEVLTSYLKDIIKPYETAGVNDLYAAIARLPFSSILTTNYDDLLETAHANKLPRLTWKDCEQIINHIRAAGPPVLIKIHGRLDDASSIVFTKSAYSAITYRQPLFAECLQMLFSLRTILFLGCGLRDQDLQHALLRAKSAIGTSFGPHFAILPEDEADPGYTQHLEKEYSIQVISCETGKDSRTRWAVYYRNLAQKLTELHGMFL